MRRIVLIAISLAMTSLVASQNLIINDSVYKPGIYKTFNEFKYNSPSIEFKYETTQKKGRYLGGSVIFHRINIDRKEGRSIGSVFGFCDGKNVYINEFSPKLKPKTGFLRIEYFDEFCYFQDIFYGTVYTGNGSLSSASLSQKIINIKNGEVFSLSKKFLRKFISDDKELLEEFNNENKKSAKLKEYFIRYMGRR